MKESGRGQLQIGKTRLKLAIQINKYTGYGKFCNHQLNDYLILINARTRTQRHQIYILHSKPEKSL